MNRKNAAARVIQAAFRKRKSAHLTLYNGTIDFKFPLDIKQLFEQVVARKNPEIRRVSVINKSFKDVLVWTKGTGVFGASAPAYHGLRIMLYYKGRNHNFVMFHTGKIQYSGGYPPDAVISAAAAPYESWFRVPATVFNIATGMNISIPELITESRDENKNALGLNNVTIQAQPIPVIPKFASMMPELRTRFTNVMQEPEMFAFVKFKHLGVSFRIMARGAVQVSGIGSPKQIPTILQFVHGELAKLFAKHASRTKVNALVYTNSRPSNNYRRATTCPKNRCPVPYSFDGVCPDMGAPTFIAPTKSGFPCCYKVPKKLNYRRNALVKRFENLGIAIPKVTRDAFKLNAVPSTGSPKNLPKNASKFTFSNTGKTGDILRNFKIGTRQCGRHTLKELSHIAAVMQLPPSIVKLRSKEALCKAIRDKSANLPNRASPNVIRMGGRRCDTFTKKELAFRARTDYGVELDNTKTLKEMCKEFQEKKRGSPSSAENNWLLNALRKEIKRSPGSNRSPGR